MKKSLLLTLLILFTGIPSLSAGDRLRLGADRMFEEPYLSWIRNKRVGLITNQTGTTSDLVSLVELLRTRSDLELTALFGPEHGIAGAVQAGEKIASGPSVFSLYGETRSPTQEMLQDVDLLIYDIQDVGVRFYTYISTMFGSMQAASRKGIPFIVLDRPNPITGVTVSGPVLEPGRESFVGIHTLPIRYGMTVGELARLLRSETSLEVDLRVVPLEGWSRAEWYDATSLQWIAPSPNMPTLTTAILYPGFCLIEGTNLSEGRGTTRPFELIGAPWLDSNRLAQRLNALHLPGVRFREQVFTPTFSKFVGEACQGVQVHVTDRTQFEPVRALLHLVREVRRLHPDQFEFRASSWDRLAGNSWIREMLTRDAAVEEIENRWKADLEKFEARRSPFLIY